MLSKFRKTIPMTAGCAQWQVITEACGLVAVASPDTARRQRAASPVIHQGRVGGAVEELAHGSRVWVVFGGGGGGDRGLFRGSGGHVWGRAYPGATWLVLTLAFWLRVRAAHPCAHVPSTCTSLLGLHSGQHRIRPRISRIILTAILKIIWQFIVTSTQL